MNVAKEIRLGKPVYDKRAISAAVKWMEPLTSAWMRVTRNYRGVGVAEAMTGAKLTEIFCKHMRKLFTYSYGNGEDCGGDCGFNGQDGGGEWGFFNHGGDNRRGDDRWSACHD